MDMNEKQFMGIMKHMMGEWAMPILKEYVQERVHAEIGKLYNDDLTLKLRDRIQEVVNDIAQKGVHISVKVV